MHIHRNRTIIGLLTAVGLLLPLLRATDITPVRAQAQQGPPPATVFVGTVEGTDAAIAVVMDGRTVLAYVCDGTPAGLATWGWFVGDHTDQHLELVATNGAVLLLDLAGEAPAGTLITRTGARHGFATEPARLPAGLWRAQGLVNGEPVLAAWVVLNDGSQRGAQLRSGSAQPVGFIDPTADNFIDPTFDDFRPQLVNVGGGTLQARPVGFVDPTTDLNR